MNQKTWIVGKPIATAITEVDPDDQNWVEKVIEITGAFQVIHMLNLTMVSTANRDMFLKAMPFELTYMSDNNQFLYCNNAHQDLIQCFQNDVPSQSGIVCQQFTVHFHQHV